MFSVVLVVNRIECIWGYGNEYANTDIIIGIFNAPYNLIVVQCLNFLSKVSSTSSQKRN